MAGERRLAREVRTGLELVEGNAQKVKAAETPSRLDALYFGKPVSARIREFGHVFAGLCLLIAAIRVYRGSDPTFTLILGGLAAVLLLLGSRFPNTLYWPWKGWMGLAHVLSLVVGPVVLAAAWTIVLLPIAMLLKIIGKHVMDLRYDRSLSTYWEERTQEENNFQLLERQF